MEEQIQSEMDTDSKWTMKKSWLFFMDTLKLGGSADTGPQATEPRSGGWCLKENSWKKVLTCNWKPGWAPGLKKQHL